MAPQWTLDLVEIDGTIRVARYLVETLNMNPIGIVDTLLRDPTLVTDEQFTVVPKTHLNWETSLAPRLLSAPVFIWHVLAHPPYTTHISFLWSRSVGSATNVFEAALPIVYGWFADACLNPPLVDLALRFGRGCVQEVIAYGAHQLRLVYGTLREHTAAIASVVDGPWRVSRVSLFSKMMHTCICHAPIPVEIVTPNAKCDIILEQNVGWVVAIV